MKVLQEMTILDGVDFKIIKKYKYFIPIIGVILFMYDVLFNYKNSVINKYYSELLGLFLIFYLWMVDMPIIVGFGLWMITHN